jgi:hypothetical protein
MKVNIPTPRKTQTPSVMNSVSRNALVEGFIDLAIFAISLDHCEFRLKFPFQLRAAPEPKEHNWVAWLTLPSLSTKSAQLLTPA